MYIADIGICRRQKKQGRLQKNLQGLRRSTRKARRERSGNHRTPKHRRRNRCLERHHPTGADSRTTLPWIPWQADIYQRSCGLTKATTSSFSTVQRFLSKQDTNGIQLLVHLAELQSELVGIKVAGCHACKEYLLIIPARQYLVFRRKAIGLLILHNLLFPLQSTTMR